MNSNMVKPEKFGHLHLVYHFTVPLSHWLSISYYDQATIKACYTSMEQHIAPNLTKQKSAIFISSYLLRI